jgi:hypothetical protein
MTREQILSQGSIEVRVKVGGILQMHKLTVIYDQTVHGKVPYLVTKARIPDSELIRLASEFQLALKSPSSTVFPPGKSAKDLALTLSQ